MNGPLDIPRHERGVVRIFDVALDGEEAERFAGDPAAIAQALGVGAIDPRYVDIFPVGRLAGLAMTDYLAEGHGIPPEALDDLAGPLNGLAGHVAVIASGAFGEGGVTLTVRPPLRHVATVAEDLPQVSFGDLPYEGARGALTGTPEDTPAPPARGGIRHHHIVAAVILVIFVLGILLSGGFS